MQNLAKGAIASQLDMGELQNKISAANYPLPFPGRDGGDLPHCKPISE
jgi:hypothetical protein